MERRHFLASAAALGLPSPNNNPLPVAEGFDVRSFGALGDGETDDTEAFRLAIAAAEARNQHTSYAPLGGGVTLDSADVYVPPGTYVVTTLHLTSASLIGSGTSSTVIKHRFSPASPDVISVGDGRSTPVYDVRITNLTVIGDGDLQKNSSPGTANRTRYGILLDKAIYKCQIDNVTVSQCQTGIKAMSSWTLNISRSLIFNCPNCLDWTGGHGGAEYCRFEGVYNPATGHSDHAVIVSYDTVSRASTATINFISCAFQGAGASAFRGVDLQSASFIGCLFERNNKANGSSAYVALEDTGIITNRAYSFIDCLWTPVSDPADTSVAVSCDRADALILQGCEFKDGRTRFAHSVVTGQNCKTVLCIGTIDSTRNRMLLHPSTACHTLADIPVFHRELRISGANGELFGIRASGDQLLIHNVVSGEILASWHVTGSADFRGHDLVNIGALRTSPSGVVGFFGVPGAGQQKVNVEPLHDEIRSTAAGTRNAIENDRRVLRDLIAALHNLGLIAIDD